MPGEVVIKNSYIILLKAMLAVFCWFSLATAQPVSSVNLSTPDLIKALQSGGHIIYMRHGISDLSQKDKNDRDLNDCSNQRNLSAAGREQVKRIGRAIKALEIPLGKVLSSPYCRCKDTAASVFGDFQIENDLAFSMPTDKEESKKLGKHLYDMMMESEASANNAVFVGHSSNLRDGLGIWPKPEGVIVVFQKKENAIIFKGMINPDEWPEY